MTVKQVLIAEKTEELRFLWRKQLEGTLVHAHTAASLAEFVELFEELKSVLDLIVFGNSYYRDRSGSVEKTIADVRRQGFTGPMFICTSDPEARERQLQAGGENTFAVAKQTLAERIRAIHGLKPNAASVLSEALGLVEPP